MLEFSSAVLPAPSLYLMVNHYVMQLNIVISQRQSESGCAYTVERDFTEWSITTQGK